MYKASQKIFTVLFLLAFLFVNEIKAQDIHYPDISIPTGIISQVIPTGDIYIGNTGMIVESPDFTGNLNISFHGVVTVQNANLPGIYKVNVKGYYDTSNPRTWLETSFELTVIQSALPAATLGNYPETDMVAGENINITPDAVPVNAVRITAASANFQGILTVNPSTGVINVINAKQAGTYQILVNAFDSNNQKTTTGFQLNVTAPVCSQGMYLSPNTLAVGTNPQDVVIGDFNHDGNLDLATANTVSKTVSVALGDGTGKLTIKSTIAIGDSPGHISSGDFNGDGNQDIIVRRPGKYDILIYFGDGAGNFTLNQSLYVDSSANEKFTVRDFNNDGNIDFAFGRGISFNNGEGSFFFGFGVSLPDLIYQTPYFFAFADFTGDGIEDFASSYFYEKDTRIEQRVIIKPGDGSGHFTTFTLQDANIGPIATGDFNNDGKQDIVQFSTVISVFIGDAGSISQTVNTKLPNLLGVNKSIQTLDFNGDGFLDILICTSRGVYFSESDLVFCKGDGTGNFEISQELKIAGKVGTIEIADLNNDGRQDVIYSNSKANNVSVILGGIPELNVKGNGILIPNGNATASLANFSDFGSTDTRTNVVRTFTVGNTGSADLILESGSVSFSGPDAHLFTVDQGTFPDTIPAGATTSIYVYFAPTTSGIKEATIHLAYQNCGNAEYTFAIQGTGVEAVTGNIGSFENTSIYSGESKVMQSSAPSEIITHLTANTSTDFDGILSVDPTSGDLRITNAKKQGKYTVTVTGYAETEKWVLNTSDSDPGEWGLEKEKQLSTIASTSFELTINAPLCSQGEFTLEKDSIIVKGDKTEAGPEGSLVSTVEPYSITVGDFDQNGIQDIITSYTSDLIQEFAYDKIPDLTGASIKLGNTDGTFFSAPESFDVIVGFDPRSIAVDDFNGNGTHDIAIANSDPIGNVFTRIGYGFYSFELPYRKTKLTATSDFNGNILAPTGIYSRDLAFGDFNNDGIKDLAVVSKGVTVLGLSGGSTVFIQLGNGLGLFKQSDFFQVGNGSVSIVIGDFNNDGYQDLATASSEENKISIRMGDGKGKFSKTIYKNIADGLQVGIGTVVDVPVGGVPSAIALGDFNNDKIQDLAVTCRGQADINGDRVNNGVVSIRIGDGKGHFGISPNSEVQVGINPSSLAVGDFNGDGVQDLAVTNEDSEDISIRFGNGDGSFSGTTQIALGIPVDPRLGAQPIVAKRKPVDLVVGDFNQDHIQDIAVLNNVTADIKVLLGKEPVAETLALKGNGISITESENIPETADNTDFGYAALEGDPVMHTFNIENTGTSIITVEGGNITGPDAGAFEISGIIFPVLIQPGASAPFNVSLNPTAEGLKSATIHLINESCGENLEYNFSIQGEVVAPPKLGVYSEQVITAGANKVITPDSPPENTTRTVAFTDAGFKGNLLVNPSTGSVTAINANPGKYEVIVQAFTLGEISSTTTFNLSVLPPIGCSQSFSGTTGGNEFRGTGLDPTSVAVGDFNNDLFQDIAISNKNSAFVSIKFGDGNGGLAGSVEIPLASNNSSSAALGDFNGDGNLDVVVANDEQNTISVALGNGNGTFEPSVSFPVGLNPNSIAIGDFNNDGNKDVVTSNVLGGSVSVVFGDGAGNFSTITEILVGSVPRMVAIGDFNSDNNQDIATANFTNSAVSIQFGNGDGTFSGTTEISVGNGPIALTVGDFNGDNNQDIATANATANTLSIRLGDGAGNFSGNINVNVTETPKSIVSGDLNADGIEDLAVSTSTNPQIIIYQGDGAGNFTENINNLYGTFSSSIIADLNSDGFMDLVQAQTNLNTTEILLGAGPNIQVKGNNNIIEDGQTIPALSNRTDLGFVQVGSSYTQFFTIENTGNASLTLGSGSLTITGTDKASFNVNGIVLPVTIAAGSSVTFGIEFTPDTKELKTATLHIASNDCNNADYDFAIQGTGSNFTLPDYPGLQKVDAGGNITITPASPPINTVSMYAFTDTNFKGSFLVNPTTGSIQVINPMPAGKYTVTVKGFENQGTDTEIIKTFELEVTDPVCSDGTFNLIDLGGSDYNLYDFVLGDFDGDGNQDLTSISSNKIQIRIGNSNGGFGTATEVIVANMDYLTKISLGDFNGDGNLDFIASGRKANLYYLLINLGNGDGTFGASTLIPLLPGERNYAFGDFNGDGIQDIVFPVSYNLSILTGNSDGSFTRNPTQSISVFGADDISAGDFNKDGAQDLAILRFHTLHIVLGDGTGGFTVNQNIDLGPTWSENVVIGDFNNDGNQDIAANTSQTYNPATPGYLAIFLGIGNGSFSNAPAIAIDNISQLAIGDFNGDGSQDLALGTGYNNISILLGKGNGTFNAAKDYAGHNKNFVIVDFNKDGKQDILGGSTSGLTKLLGRGKINIKEGGSSSNDLIIADGDNSPSEYKRTDFGNTCISNSITKTYTIENNGSSILNLANGSITISGSSEFKIEGITLPASVNPDASITFTVRFLPTTQGLKTATIHVANNDCGDSDYDFAIQGIGDSPQIEPVIVGSYTNISIMAGENIRITPDAVPENTESAVAYTNTSFPGILTVNPITGVLTVTNAKLAGTYEITVEAFGLCRSATTSFILTVTDPLCSAGTFTITEGIDTGDPNKTILLADINRDDILDLVIAQNQKILVRLGNGDATFRESTVIDIDNFPSGYKSIAIGDFNGDGSQDIVSTAAQKLSVYLSDGKDNFVLSSSLFMTNLTDEVAVTDDFNKDGRLDIIVKLADETINESLLSVFLGDGSGGFTNRNDIAIESVGAGVTSGDFNNDGKIDIAVANTKTKTVSIRLGDGLGGFSGNTELVCGVQPKSIAVGDFNRDGKQDLAVTITGDGFKVVGDVVTPLTGQAITIFMGRGNGTFNAGTNLDVYDDPDLNADYPWSISVGDYNGDGIQDLALDMMLSFTMPIYLGDGAGGFSNNLNLPLKGWAGSIVSGDINGDGRQDILTADWFSNIISVFLNESPEIEVKSNSLTIADGDNTPSVTDNTDFGNICLTGSVAKTFTIENNGSSDLVLSNGSITLTGADNTLFTLGDIALPKTISANESATFTVTFAPTTLGVKTATLHIANNSCDKADYDFTITGTGGADGVPPVITCPVVNDTYYTDAEKCYATIDLKATATANCDLVPVITSDAPANNQYPVGETVVTYKAIDENGNESSCSLTINVINSSAPVINCLESIAMQFGESTLPANTGNATAESCDPNITFTYFDISTQGNSGFSFYNYKINRYWTVEDSNGNSDFCIQEITVSDQTAPVIACTHDLDIESEASSDPSNTGMPTVTDNGDPNPAITYSDVIVINACPAQSVLTRTFRATDISGNPATCVQIIKITDTTPPVISCYPEINIESGSSTEPINTEIASVTDNTDPAPFVAYSDIITIGSCANEYTIKRTWTAQDACGNVSTREQLIKATDTSAPVLICAPDVTIEAGESDDPSVTGMATVTDKADPNPSLTYIDAVAEGSCPNESVITRTWTATDACGNESSCIQTIKVTDTTAPFISCVPDITIEAGESADPTNTGTAEGTDENDENPEINYTDEVVDGTCLNESVITRTWTATDACGNVSSCIQVITVSDNTAPEIECVPDITIETGDSSDPLNTRAVTATDSNDENPEITYVDEVANGSCPNESVITRTWTATDACGNTNSCIQIITVSDTTSPEIFCAPDITIEANKSIDPSNTGAAVATDANDANPEISYTDVVFLDGLAHQSVITRTWTATDACGNASTCIQIITVNENTTSSSTVTDAKGYLKLYPVPAIDDLTIEWLGSVDNSSIQFKVNDVRGRLVDQFKLHSKSGPNYYKLDIRNLAPMTYVISAVVDGVLMNGKFIKK